MFSHTYIILLMNVTRHDTLIHPLEQIKKIQKRLLNIFTCTAYITMFQSEKGAITKRKSKAHKVHKRAKVCHFGAVVFFCYYCKNFIFSCC